MLERVFGPEIKPPMKHGPHIEDPTMAVSLKKIMEQYLNIILRYRQLAAKGYMIEGTNNGDLQLAANGKLLSLSTFLPNDYNLVPGEKFSAEIEDKAVIYNPDRIRSRAFIFDLLHEAGHVAERGSRGNKRKIVHRPIDELASSVYILYKMSSDLPNISKRLVRGQSITGDDKKEMWTPNYQIRRSDKQKSQEERFAWAWALNQARKLESEDFPVISSFGATEDLRLYVSACLTTYEISRAYRLSRKTGGNTRSELTYNFLRKNRLEQVLNTRIETSVG